MFAMLTEISGKKRCTRPHSLKVVACNESHRLFSALYLVLGLFSKFIKLSLLIFQILLDFRLLGTGILLIVILYYKQLGIQGCVYKVQSLLFKNNIAKYNY